MLQERRKPFFPRKIEIGYDKSLGFWYVAILACHLLSKNQILSYTFYRTYEISYEFRNSFCHAS